MLNVADFSGTHAQCISLCFRGMKMAGLTVEINDNSAGIPVIRLIGTVDAQTFFEMDEALTELCEQGKRKIIIDANSLDYITSARVGSLVGHFTSIRENNGDLVFVGLDNNDTVYRVFELLGMTAIFPHVASEEEAMKMLGKD